MKWIMNRDRIRKAMRYAMLTRTGSKQAKKRDLKVNEKKGELVRERKKTEMKRKRERQDANTCRLSKSS